MSRLYPCVPPAPDETATSYVSRLARRNGIGSTVVFCKELGVPLSKVGVGDPGVLERLSYLTEEASEELADRCVTHLGNGGYRLAGETFVRDALRRGDPHVCPACLADDIARGDGPPLADTFERRLWKLASVRTCPVHGLALTSLAGNVGHVRGNDFGGLVEGVLPDLGRMVEASRARPASGLELYARDRLARRLTADSWLDLMPMHVALNLCEILGLGILFDRHRGLKDLSQDEWHEAGGVGFDLARRGEDAVRGHLAHLQATFPRGRRSKEGGQAQFGTFYRWLHGHRDDPAYATVVDLVVGHLVETEPLGPGDVVLGTEIRYRKLHSVWTAHKEHRLHPKRLKKVLIATGVVSRDQAGLPDDRVLFEIDKAGPVLAKLAGALSMKELPRYLGTNLLRARSLVQDEVIVPFVTDDDGAVFQAFARGDLDAFLASLLDGAEVVDAIPADAFGIENASKAFTRRTSEVIGAITSGRVGWVGRLANGHGLASVLVRREEMREALWGGIEPPLMVPDAIRVLGTSLKVAVALIEKGYLPSQQERSPFKRAPVRVVDREGLTAFKARYVSLFEAAKASGVHHLKLQAGLAERGILPAIPREEVGASFFARCDIE